MPDAPKKKAGSASLLKKTAAAALVLCTALAALLFYTAARLNIRSARAEHLIRAPEEERRDVFSRALAAWNASAARSAPTESVYALPPAVKAAEPLPPDTLRAESAVIIDASSGAVLFEKNADVVVPPASMTKIAAMYTAFRLMDLQGVSMDQKAALPPESWAVNIPPGSSLMFLAEGQRVTMRELFEGMSVASGNDAAIAVACNLSGSLQEFVREMNRDMVRLDLPQTRFVEPSGLSEYNRTTAREFARFSKAYIEEYPWALETFHSLRSIAYPKIWNLPAAAARNAQADEDGNTARTIRQHATNRLLGTLEGCDGLKTGYIDESGYNFSVTAKRGGTRVIAVLTGGPGNTSAEGSRIRAEDGSAAIEWAFANFRTLRPAPPEPVAVVCWGAKDGYATVIPAEEAAFTVEAAAPQAVLRMELGGDLSAPIRAGEEVGRAVWYAPAGREVGSVTLISAEDETPGNVFKRAADALAQKAAGALGKR